VTYFKVCDTWHAHPKRRAAGNAAAGLWTAAGSWSGQQLTDGHIPLYVVNNYGTLAQAARLCQVRLWHPPGHDCPACPQPVDNYVFHEWARHNKTRAQVENEREKWRLKQAGYRSTKDEPQGQPVVSPGDAPWDMVVVSPGESPKSPGMEEGDFDSALTATTHLPCEHNEPRGSWACALCRRDARAS
jgi:hypothetical protein